MNFFFVFFVTKVVLPKSAPAMKAKTLQERRKKQILAAKVAKPKKIGGPKKAAAAPAKATKPVAAKTGKAAPAKK